MKPTIRVLPPDVVNRIAAGEVVERPASVLKELLENSIDSGATEISVQLEEGGKKRILVRDNGSGIARDDLPLAFASHATSKLEEEHLRANLLGVATMGFRGEALASIGSVAMAEIVSRVHGADHAYRFRPGTEGPLPAAGEPGTTLEVRTLFYNTPARRKFLRSNSAELSHSVQQFTRIALGFAGIHFRLAHAGQQLLDLPAVDHLRQRLEQLLGGETAGDLLEVRKADASGSPSLEGFVGSPRLHRRDTRDQHFFVNGRWVRDRALSHALRMAYEGFQIPGKHPVAYLFVDLRASDVDVNVHPTKTEVRFREPSAVYGLVRSAVRNALERSGPETAGRSLPEAGGEGGRPASGFTPTVGSWDDVWKARRAKAEQASSAPSLPLQAELDVAGASSRIADVAEPEAPRSRRAVQLLDSYLLVESPEGITLVDQHALHEKILFEEIYEKIQRGVIERQRLLVPDVIDVGPELMPLVEQLASKLANFGFEIEAFGEQTVAVHAIPGLFDREAGRTEPSEIVRAMLECLKDSHETESGAEEAPEALHKELRGLASTIACKRAVKAGMPLREEEVRSLLDRGDLAEDPRYCPHGRPTTVFLSRRDIEKQFDRK